MKELPLIISASRMTDMPAFYPANIIRETELRKAKGKRIHTIVLWTKHAGSLFREPLYSYLLDQKKTGTQLYVQLTVTGMGKDIFVYGKNRKIFLEPGVPDYLQSVYLLEKVSVLTGNPERIRLRIDPLVCLKDNENNRYNNFAILPEIVEIARSLGINNFTFSFLEKDIYKKIDQRFNKEGIHIEPPSPDERLLLAKEFNELARDKKVIISACSVPGLPESACIDGALLQKLHDGHWPTDLSQPRSRTLCGCTKSIDIGGWPPSVCFSGCLYCYARPAIR